MMKLSPDKFDAVLGIDPGSASGYMALINANARGRVFGCLAFKDLTLEEVRNTLVDWHLKYRLFAVIEGVNSLPGQGIASSSKFARHTGAIEGMLLALFIPYEKVYPQTWQRTFNLGGSFKWRHPELKESALKTMRKQSHKKVAQSLFFSSSVTKASADAFLLAEHGRRKVCAIAGI